MADSNPLHKTIDDRVNEKYTWGIRNAQLQTMASGLEMKKISANDARQRLYLIQNNLKIIDDQFKNTTSDSYKIKSAPTQNPESSGLQTHLTSPNRRRRLYKVPVSAYVNAATISVAILSWTSFLWVFIQMPLAVFSIIMLGASIYLSENVLVDGAIKVYNLVGTVFGLPAIDIPTLFFISLILVIMVGFISLAGALFHYRLFGLNPFGGQTGVALKQKTFLMSFVLYFIPGFNLFPWIWIWLLTVTRYPK
jgi:hypothetical protein